MKLVAESHRSEKPKHNLWGPAVDPDPLGLSGCRVSVHRNGRSYEGVVNLTEEDDEIPRCFIVLDCGSSGWFAIDDVDAC